MILFEDEGRFGRISDLRDCWAPPGVRPLVARQVVRQSVYAFAAIAPLEGRLFWRTEAKCNTEAMSRFLLQILESEPLRRIVMFVDGAGWHRAKTLPLAERLRVEFLPPYTPECNPVEHLWEQLREKEMGNWLFGTLDAVVEKLRIGLENLQYSQHKLLSMCGFPWIKK